MARKRENMTDMEKEARSGTFKKVLVRELGCACGNCGSTENVEYHHVVPLVFGGTNSLTNIVPLCYKCHRAAHNGRHITSFADHSHSDDGRPPKCDDDTAFRAFDLLLDGQIGNKKCKEMMNLSGTTQPRSVAQFQRWKKSRGVVDMRSSLDVSATNSGLYPGKVVGWVIYDGPDRKKKSITYKDTGINDVEYGRRVITGCRRCTAV